MSPYNIPPQIIKIYIFLVLNTSFGTPGYHALGRLGPNDSAFRLARNSAYGGDKNLRQHATLTFLLSQARITV